MTKLLALVLIATLSADIIDEVFIPTIGMNASDHPDGAEDMAHASRIIDAIDRLPLCRLYPKSVPKHAP
ncbi:MAG: hypothetical protein AAGA73_10770 [Pseudomonadota bacterium]